MKNPAVFYGAIVVAVITLILAIYYMIPGVTKFLVSSDPTGAHIKHAVLFGALFVVSLLVAAVARPKKAAL
ncbi:MAG TPA: hypothetical protein VFN23_05400 [Ktedonobacteraceae bacterium]|nr:hypothetical protein [Ktedonobacteraceae bacterium]